MSKAYVQIRLKTMAPCMNSQRGNKPKTQTLQIEMEAEANETRSHLLILDYHANSSHEHKDMDSELHFPIYFEMFLSNSKCCICAGYTQNTSNMIPLK